MSDRREYQRIYREKNKDKIREYRSENREKLAEIKKRYREKNKAKISERTKIYREKNAEKIREYMTQYREKNKGGEMKKFNKGKSGVGTYSWDLSGKTLKLTFKIDEGWGSGDEIDLENGIKMLEMLGLKIRRDDNDEEKVKND